METTKNPSMFRLVEAYLQITARGRCCPTLCLHFLLGSVHDVILTRVAPPSTDRPQVTKRTPRSVRGTRSSEPATSPRPSKGVRLSVVRLSVCPFVCPLSDCPTVRRFPLLCCYCRIEKTKNEPTRKRRKDKEEEEEQDDHHRRRSWRG